MTVIRDGINLTKLPDDTLYRVLNTLGEYPGVQDQYRFNRRYLQLVTARRAVSCCAMMIDAWKQCGTVTTATPPSPESLDWSNLEGGSLHHAEPDFAKWFREFEVVRASLPEDTPFLTSCISIFDTLKDREYDSHAT